MSKEGRGQLVICPQGWKERFITRCLLKVSPLPPNGQYTSYVTDVIRSGFL